MSDLQIAATVVLAEKEPRVGGMAKLGHALSPEDRRKVQEVVMLYDQQRDAGRHGHPEDVLEAFEVSKELADRVTDALEADYVAEQLQLRRGCDADRPLPELTRRDYIDAAIDVHSKE